jgi:hypothetical protein
MFWLVSIPMVRTRPARFAVPGMALALIASACINVPAMLTQQVEARGLLSEMRVQFTRSADAANRAVMAVTDETSADAAREAEQATRSVDEALSRLPPLLASLGYADEQKQLEAFNASFAEYRKLDAEILPLAVENTNLKAQRLSFGASREALDAFRQSLDMFVKSAASARACCVEAVAGRAVTAVMEIQVVQAPHIAEADDAAMTRMEEQMAQSEAAARRALGELRGLLEPAAGPQLAQATTALDRFAAVNKEIIVLSRRNSNVRSLALSLGRKRTVTAACQDQLRVLDESLAKRQLSATR